MAYLTPANKQYLAIITTALSGVILLLGQIPFLNISTSYPLFGLVTLGQLLGILNLFIAYLLYKKELR